MTSDYKAIRRENELRYGTDIGRIGRMLLSDRYDDRTHFIFELLQNAEDALARRSDRGGRKSVRFRLSERAVYISHFGKPFDERDVRGICGIAESTKSLTEIGRFGIGFKSVYAFTERPEIHSGEEDFAVENFVLPVSVPSVIRDSSETVVIIPLRTPGETDHGEIAARLKNLGAGSLLFLRNVDEIEWSIEGGSSGIYLRSEPERQDEGVRRIAVIGQEEEKRETDQTWLVFDRPVFTSGGLAAGHVEIAFSLTKEKKLVGERVLPISNSPLVVFFPTVVETNLGFLVHGPYRTTPSRDNVPRNDEWNQHCVLETARLLVDALRWLRDHELLDTGVLRCLPIARAKFEGTMLMTLYDATKAALSSQAFLPRFGTGHIAAAQARLARTQELRELFDPSQLASLFGVDEQLSWISGDISPDRTPELHEYLIDELEVMEVTPETVLSKLDQPFLELQSDAWILRLYEFLNGQRALLDRAASLPLIRLRDGSHVTAVDKKKRRAFLPGTIETGFPTVRSAVCSSQKAREFLLAIGLTESHPVDDVILNILPNYMDDKHGEIEKNYESDIRRILKAYETDSKVQQEKLVMALQHTPFVKAIDVGSSTKVIAAPGGLYISTERLKRLFAGVPNILLVDDSYPCLRGEQIRVLLETCGADRNLKADAVPHALSSEERKDLRIRTGHAETSGQNDHVSDCMLNGLNGLLALLSGFDTEERRSKASLLWEELGYLEERRGKGLFTAQYTWTHYGRHNASTDAAFVRLLNESAWVPDRAGELQRPDLVLFDSLGWKPNPFLQSKIRFKAPIIDQLAKEAGIEPGVLALLKKLGVTSEVELRGLLRHTDENSPTAGEPNDNGKETRGAFSDEWPNPKQSGEQTDFDTEQLGAGTSEVSRNSETNSLNDHNEHEDVDGGSESGSAANNSQADRGNRTPQGTSSYSFVSYVAVHPDDGETDPDGLDHSARMSLEKNAIDHILDCEAFWRRTPPNNPGFDLFEADENGQPIRWCEVKAMTSSLRDRPVGLSHTQFRHAQERGQKYWLYVVEQARSDNPRIVRIQDPAGKACTYTFDHGWLSVADVDAEQGNLKKPRT